MENPSHTIFLQFQKIVEKRFELVFCGYLNQIKQSGDEKKTNFFLEKTTYHTISIYKNCMTSIFLMAIATIFPNNMEIAPKNFCFFFQLQIEFCIQTIIF